MNEADMDAEDVEVPALVQIRRARGDAPGSWQRGTIPPKPLTAEERAAGAALTAPAGAKRPRTRGECVDGPRPCPWVSCKYHLYLDVTVTGSIVVHRPNVEVWEMAETCALDVADRGGESLPAVGDTMGVARQRADQIIVAALEKVREMRVAFEQPPELER